MGSYWNQSLGFSDDDHFSTARWTLAVTRVLLTGVACVGKSTIGAELARLLRIPFFDLDKEVEGFYHEPIPRLQARFFNMSNYRGKACRVLKDILAQPDAPECVIALPPSGLRSPYWNVIRASGSKVIVLRDDPVNILARIVFYDDDSRPMARVLTPEERELYLDEIEKDMRYFARSYSKADATVEIDELCPAEAAKKIEAVIESFGREIGESRRPRT
jgi:shikimate kinase